MVMPIRLVPRIPSQPSRPTSNPSPCSRPAIGGHRTAKPDGVDGEITDAGSERALPRLA